MKIPNKIKIGKSTWDIEFDPWIEYADDAVGLCIPKLKKIILSPLLDKHDLEETFVHELLHACWPEGVVGDKKEEEIVGKLAVKLTEALKNGNIISKEDAKLPSKKRSYK